MHAHDWLNSVDLETTVSVSKYLEVRFKAGRKSIYFNSGDHELVIGDPVIVEADRGIDFGTVNLTGELVAVRMRASNSDNTGEYQSILRRATLEDIEHAENIPEREADAFAVIRACVAQHHLDMRIVDVEWQFDGNKVTAYFTAEKRVDFRKLVRDLAGKLRTRIELRQIGSRDAAARIGGVGVCGLELCCSTWIQEFKPVSTSAAKTQGLPLNPVRLSGLCGRLKCCLNYELDQYMSLLKKFPSYGQRVMTPQGESRVIRVDIFKEMVGVELASGEITDFALSEVTVESKTVRRRSPDGTKRTSKPKKPKRKNRPS